MKTKKLGKKLALSKTTVVNLEQNMLSAVRGGYWETEMWGGCTTWHPVCYSQPAQICQTQLSVCKCEPPETFDIC